tara:strand:- start:1840 stop:2667 length:828 start_codon:yes stop_codon:yes gene_type:complete
MKNFLYLVLELIIFSLLFLLAIDKLLVYISNNSKNIDVNRPSMMKNNEYDIVFFGSSKIKHGIDTKVFQNNNISTFNFGITGGATLVESYYLAQEFFTHSYAGRYAVFEISPVREGIPNCINKFLLFHEKDLWIDYFNHYDYYFQKIPFFRLRLTTFESFENIVLNIFFEASDLSSNGFVPLQFSESVKNSYVSSYQIDSEWIQKISTLCDSMKIKPLFLLMPTMNKYEILISDTTILNHSNIIKEEKYFHDSKHLNADGATFYSQYLLDNIFNH